VATGKRVVRIRRPGDPFAQTLGHFSLAFSPDGRILAGSWPGGVIYLWDSATGKEIQQFRGHCNDVRCVAFSPDGRLLFSGSDDGTILGWDVSGRAQQ
jgi:WD40 repeat protein